MNQSGGECGHPPLFPDIFTLHSFFLLSYSHFPLFTFSVHVSHTPLRGTKTYLYLSNHSTIHTDTHIVADTLFCYFFKLSMQSIQPSWSLCIAALLSGRCMTSQKRAHVCVVCVCVCVCAYVCVCVHIQVGSHEVVWGAVLVCDWVFHINTCEEKSFKISCILSKGFIRDMMTREQKCKIWDSATAFVLISGFPTNNSIITVLST